MKVARMWHVPSKVMRFVLYRFIFHFGIQKMKGMLHTFTLRFRVRKAACFSAPQWSGKHFALGLMIPTGSELAQINFRKSAQIQSLAPHLPPNHQSPQII